MLKEIKKIFQLISDVQMYAVFTVFYLIILFPFALYIKFFQDPFKRKTRKSLWEKTDITFKSINPTKQF